MKSLLLATTVLALGVGTAAAQDQVYDWSGAYVGVQAGYGWGDYDQFVHYGAGLKNSAGPNIDVKDGLGGVFAGYNWQLARRLVLGVEADISTGLDGTVPIGTRSHSIICTIGECNVDINWFATLRGRIGYAIDRLHVYGTGGLAYADTDGGIFNTSFQGSSTETGWAAGAGLEYAFTNNLIARGEYLRIDLGDLRFGETAGGVPYKGKGSFDTVRFGIAYKF